MLCYLTLNASAMLCSCAYQRVNLYLFSSIELLTVERHWKCTSIDLNWIRESDYCYSSLKISRLLRYQLMLEHWTDFGTQFRYFSKLYYVWFVLHDLNKLFKKTEKKTFDNFCIFRQILPWKLSERSMFVIIYRFLFVCAERNKSNQRKIIKIWWLR